MCLSPLAQIMYGLVVQKDKDEHKVIRLCVDTGGKKKQAEPVRAERKHMKNEAEALAAFCNEIPQSILCHKALEASSCGGYAGISDTPTSPAGL